MKKLTSVFGGALLAAGLTIAPVSQSQANILSDTFDYVSGQTKLDKSLVTAIKAKDVAGVENALEKGARADASAYANSFSSPLYLAAEASFWRGAPEASDMVALLLEHGAVPDERTMSDVFDQHPSYRYEDENGFYDELNEVTDLLMISAREHWQQDDFTELLFDTWSVSCKSRPVELLLEAGANPNDAEFLIDFTKTVKKGVVTTETNVSASFGWFPLRQCLSNQILNPDNERIRAQTTATINTLLDYGADPSLILDDSTNLYELDSDSEAAFEAFGVKEYKVDEAEKALLREILEERNRGTVIQAPALAP